MDFSVTSGLTDSLSALRQARTARGYAPIKPLTASPANDAEEKSGLPAPLTTTKNVSGGTRLVGQQQEDLAEGGYRRTLTFEKEDGRTFTKIEEFALTDRGARKTVIQQNPSGSLTRYEEVLDRENSGNFRRTQRFQDGVGDVATTITPDYQVTDPFILTAGQAPGSFAVYSSPFAQTRGTQLDLRA